MVVISFELFAQENSWSLQKCIDEALKNNLSIKKTALTNQLNQKTLEQSKANIIPVISGNASQQMNFGRSIDPSSNQFINQRISSNNFSLNGSLVLFNGFQNQNTIQQNNLNYQAGVYDVEKSKNDIILNVIGYYMQILLFVEQINALKIQLSNSNSQLKRNEILLNKGTITEDTYYKLKAQIATDEQSILDIQNKLSQAKLNINQQMQIPYDPDFKIDTVNSMQDFKLENVSNSNEIYQYAEKNLPQIKSLDLRVKGTEYYLKVARGGFYPRLTLNAAVATIYSSQYKEVKDIIGLNSVTTGFVNNDLTLPVYTTYPSYSQQTTPFNKQLENNLYQFVGLNLIIPIINAKINRINVDKAKINTDLAIVNKELAKNQLKLDVENTINTYAFAIKKYEVSQSNLNSRTISFQLIEKRYNSGQLTIFNYLDEKNGLEKAQLDMLQAKYEVIFRKKLLDFYQGNITY